MKKYKQQLKSKEQYFKEFSNESLEELGPEEKEYIYNDYYVRHTVYNRDNFECQVENCPFKDSLPTIHHYKHKDNEGRHTIRNCVLVCQTHQAQYHRGKEFIRYKDTPNLPPHIRGHTQALHQYIAKQNGSEVDAQITFIINKTMMKELRKNNKHLHGRVLTTSEIIILFMWLNKYAIKVEADDTSPL